MVDIVRQSQQRGFPSQDEWPTVAKGLLESMQRAEHLAGGPRTAAVNHNKAVSECMHGLAWVTIDGAQAGARSLWLSACAAQPAPCAAPTRGGRAEADSVNAAH